MAKFTNDTALDAALNIIKNNANKMYLIKAYAFGDSYATVLGNKVAEVAMAPTDMIVADGDSGGRKLTVAAKNAVPLTAGTGTTPNLHIALVNDTGTTVYAVTDETSNQEMASGIEVNIPAWQVVVADPI
jgi:hypothetical protein